MWHPASRGTSVVGVIGYVLPQTFGSVTTTSTIMLSGELAAPLKMLLLLGVLKFLSWTISLGSGTAGGTRRSSRLAAAERYLRRRDAAHVSARADQHRHGCGFVGMVAIFAGGCLSMLTSVVFAVETTRVVRCWRLVGCATAYLISCLLMRHSIMTVKMAKSGVMVPQEYVADFLDQVLVKEQMSSPVVTLKSTDTVEKIRNWIATHARIRVIRSSTPKAISLASSPAAICSIRIRPRLQISKR